MLENSLSFHLFAMLRRNVVEYGDTKPFPLSDDTKDLEGTSHDRVNASDDSLTETETTKRAKASFR